MKSTEYTFAVSGFIHDIVIVKQDTETYALLA
jgi:hypothetical protein